MTHPNHQTNGASLEDCHTNFFALTDLCGIKWRKLVWGESNFSPEPLEDPVLSSFSRCLAGDILCVWRRVGAAQQQSSGGGLFDPIGLPQPSGPTHPPLSLQAAKELWIFWYGEEPDLSGLVTPELLSSEGEQGSWESGLSYECRSLLFKALHNLIERCLLSRDFVRLGKWFVQPYDGSEKMLEKSGHLSFSFAFFVHGESTVCASVDVRQHPPVRSLVRTHLQQAQACLHSGSGVQVILAPFGLAGTLTGQSFKALDAQTHRLMEDWRHFYPTREPADLPPAVEVIVGGVKLRYPSCYVLVTDLDETTATLMSTQTAGMKASCLPSTGVTVSVVPQHQHHPDCMVHAATPSTVLPERVWQDATISTTPQGDASPATPLPENSDHSREMTGHWDFQDPTQKHSCTCAKCRKLTRGVRGRVPFHKRPPGRELEESLTRLSSVYGQQSTPHHQQNDSLPVPSVGSPPSVVPSPLPNPHSVPQPASVPPPDPTMPTLSPQPPPPHHHLPTQSPAEDKVVSTPEGHFHGPKSVSSVSNQVFSPYPLALSVEGNKAVDSVGGPESAPPQPSGGPASAPLPPVNQEPPPPTLKRPILYSKEYESVLQEEDQPSHLLYDYSTLDAWLNHPVKRFKPIENRSETLRSSYPPCNMYPNPQENPSPPQMYIKQEPGVMPMEIDNGAPGGGMGGKRSDPYEFEDDGTTTAVSMEGFKRNPAMPQIKEEVDKKDFDGVTLNGPKCPSGNLFTNEGLQTTAKDLERMFDISEDTSSPDETGISLLALQVPTPPGSNKASDDCGTGTLMVRPPRGSGGGVRPEELSKMFPTPPSHEHNPIASPCGGQPSDTPVHETTDFMPQGLITRVKQESIYPNMGSPQEESIEDWSYVFRPPTIWKFVGSSKYAPLTNLPSQSSPPVTLPSHCVYKPSWLYSPHSHHQEKPAGHMNNLLPNVTHQHPARSNNHPSLPPPPQPGLHPRGALSPYPASPMQWRPPCPAPPPPPYSPAQPPAMYKVGPGRPPEANSLVVNLLLADTALNIFRDHNFDSCTLCVCNAGSKVVGNIRGADAGVYLPQPGTPMSPYVPPGVFSPGHHVPEEDPIRCSCGFSAVVNRRLSHRSGLFFEDEMEITGLCEEREENNHPGLVGAALGVMDLVREQCVVVHSASNSLYRAARQHRPLSAPATLNLLEFGDSNQVTLAALEQGRQAQLETNTVGMCQVQEMAARQQQILQQQHCGQMGGKVPAVHRWAYLRARGPRCNQDIVRIMKTLQPLLQDAIQKKCTTSLWDAPYTVNGPLTWRQFHRLAGRGTDDRCEPQPIPSVVVGHEKDWLSLTPYALQYWEKLLLEPYSYARDIAYIVVAPDNDYVLQRVRNFFKELSSTYEMCRLGRHCPITKVLREGILRVGNKAAMKLAKEPVDEWFTMLGENTTTNMLKLYAQVCRHHLAPLLSQVPLDHTLLDPPEGSAPSRPVPTPSPMPPPSTPESQSSERAPSTPKPSEQEDCGRGESATSGPGDCSHDDENIEPPSIVVYLVEPFTLGSDSSDLQRLACLGLLRCFNTVLSALPEHIKANITLQIISLESIVELGRSGDRIRRNDHIRALALSVFSQCRRQLQHQANSVKALTGFGTAACAELFLKEKDEKNRAPYKVYTPPYILSHSNVKGRGECGESLSSEQQCSVMYVSYCLSEDQRWLLATATDEQGLILETATINVHIPNRSRRRKASARRFGLQKLMDFILGVMSQTVTSWRLIVGRVGRIGHGELKGWSWLLSRKSLLRASKHLKEICKQCNLMYPHDVPCILSACLVSLEPDSALRLMPDQFTPDERFSQASVKCQLSTPQDVTCTHILVFPTSATTQSSQTAFQEQNEITGPELGDEELFNALNDDMPDNINVFNDIFSTWPEAETEAGGVRSPGGSRGGGGDSSQPGSPCITGADDHHSPFPSNGQSRNSEIQEEVGTLLQQPLALGYLVSTAPTGRMPRWFWSACPHLESACPAFLKNALHLHSTAIQQNSDELLQQQSAVVGHPLDSQYTTDVLRYVLEGYNALSWLALDSNTHDRLSCLPVHMQILMQLYHMTSALV